VTFVCFRELYLRTYKRSGGISKFPAVQFGKVGEGWKGIDEGCGKWVEPADLPTPHMMMMMTAIMV